TLRRGISTTCSRAPARRTPTAGTAWCVPATASFPTGWPAASASCSTRPPGEAPAGWRTRSGCFLRWPPSPASFGRHPAAGATCEAEKRFAHGIGFHGSYTLSRVRNNVDSLANLADLPEGTDIDGETTLSRQDVRHRFTLTVLSELPAAAGAAQGVKVSALVS